jgi:uncharacterized protein YwgA
MVVAISRNAQLLKFFAQQYPGIPRKRLVKMAYMADLIARQYLGHPISEFEYRADHFGPYPPEITDALAELEAEGLAWTRATEATAEGPSWKQLFDSGHRIVFEFSLEENEVLGYVVKNYLNMPMEELLEDVVYQTTPYKASESFRERLRMEMADNEGKKLVGFDLRAIINAERQVDAGEYLVAREYFDGLRNRIAARHAGRD